MLANKKKPEYTSPKLSLAFLMNEDVITSSVEENLGGIPEGWGTLFIRGDFE